MRDRIRIKNIWLAIGLVSLGLIAYRWFGSDSENIRNTLIALNGIGFVLSLPCSIFVVPVAVASSYYMGMNPTSSEGIYLNTIMLFVVGLTQWFWIERFWSGASHRLQGLELYDVK